ncbi:hypothetical protein Sango_3083700 [Sesamum angolense]|uniref:Reverse transcriptase zinc-binding domain-containing protein n=1 Tax=Sesamum angolense TaxID=2727404 RepID=A0AAE1TA02_9LAMI|nr:hypothetical protein Sango_3083700 [Sesamum angolense]
METWIDCWLMMLGYDGRIRIINVLTLGLPITPHLCSEEILINIRIEGTSMYAVTRKLRALKPVFRTLRKKKGDLSVNVKLAAEFLATVQQLLQIDRHNSLLLCLEKCCKLVFFKATKLEQVMLQQRAKIQWLKGGDQCFGYSSERRIFDIAEDKAPGPDGYSSGFYKAAWPVIGEEMIKDILEFFTTGRLLKQVNTTILALIPKRLRLVLDKLISPYQNAFVPGRSIGDNILLAQELFAGYNRQGLPMRCALKVDLRKAYDTVEWDFLSAVLQLFGFPGTFITWVEECVTTPMFSNEGFSSIGGARSLDYSNFALQMTSSSSVKLMWLRFGFRHGLDEFAKLSEMHTNPQKSQLILSVQHRMSGTTTCSTTFPGGSPSPQDGKHSVVLCGETSIDQIGAHVTKCLLGNGLHITERVIREVEKKMRTFLWKGNSTVGSKSGMECEQPVVHLGKWITHTRLRHKSVWTVDVKGGSWGWRKILRLRSALLPIEFKIGDGESFSLWHDPWHSLGSLITRFSRGPGRTNIPEAAKLSEVLVDGDWSWPPIMDLECIEILHMLPIIHNGSDSILWRGGGFSTKTVYDIFRNHGPKVGWYSLLLGPCKIPRYSFVLWMAILDKLSTMDKPWLSHLGGVCVMCGREMETHEHLFFRCNYSRQCIRILKGTVRFTWPNQAWAVDIAWASKRWNGRHIVQVAYRALLAAIVYHIWTSITRTKRYGDMGSPCLSPVLPRRIHAPHHSQQLRINVSNVAFNCFKRRPVLKKSIMACDTSSPTTGHAALKKPEENPSGPGALSSSISKKVVLTSSMVTGRIIAPASSSLRIC